MQNNTMATAQLRADIDAITADLPGEFGVYAARLDARECLSLNADEHFPTASSIKIFILYALLRGVDRHQISLSERLDYPSRHATPGSGVLYHLDPGLQPTLRDLAILMMMISDNSATNLLIEYLGLAEINHAIAELPLPNTRIGSWQNFIESDRDSYKLGQSTPREMAQFLRWARQPRLFSPSAQTLFWDILRIQKYIEPLRKYLPADPWAREWGQPEPVWVASKTGYLIDCTTESGLVHADGTEWVISIMTRAMPETASGQENPAEAAISQISARIYKAWSQH